MTGRHGQAAEATAFEDPVCAWPRPILQAMTWFERQLRELQIGHEADLSQEILETQRFVLEQARKTARDQGMLDEILDQSAPCRLDARFLAVAMAHALVATAGELTAGGLTTQGADKAESSRRTLEQPIAALWQRLVEPKNGPTTCLSDLVWSLACERRPDWNAGRPEGLGKDAFARLWARLQPQLVAQIAARNRGCDDLVDQSVSDAFVSMHDLYWRPESVRRWRAQARIGTYLYTSAIRSFVRLKEKEDRAGRPLSLDASDEGGQHAALQVADHSAGPAEAAAVQPLPGNPRYDEALADCIQELQSQDRKHSPDGGKRRLVAQLVWIEHVEGKVIAGRLDITPPMVTKYKQTARLQVADCMESKGLEFFDPTERPKSRRGVR